MMIKLRYLDNNQFLIQYNGNRSEFDSYINAIFKKLYYHAKPNLDTGGGWIFHYSKLEEIQNLFKDIKYENNYTAPPYIDIGKDMKLQPYEYQKEAIYFAINNLNSLMVLPCGSGKLINFAVLSQILQKTQED